MNSISCEERRQEHINPKGITPKWVVPCMGYLRNPVDSILEAVLTVSPKRQYRGIVRPTTPATQGPGHTHEQTQHLLGFSSFSKVLTIFKLYVKKIIIIII